MKSLEFGSQFDKSILLLFPLDEVSLLFLFLVETEDIDRLIDFLVFCFIFSKSPTEDLVEEQSVLEL